MSSDEKKTTAYRGSTPDDIDYKTPKKPWHPATWWFIGFVCNFVAAYVSFNVAAYFPAGAHPMITGNGVALGFIFTVAAIVTFAVFGHERWKWFS